MSAWEDIADSPEEAENLRIRAALMRAIRSRVAEIGWSQTAAAHKLGLTQPRLSDLYRGKISSSPSTHWSTSPPNSASTSASKSMRTSNCPPDSLLFAGAPNTTLTFVEHELAQRVSRGDAGAVAVSDNPGKHRRQRRGRRSPCPVPDINHCEVVVPDRLVCASFHSLQAAKHHPRAAGVRTRISITCSDDDSVAAAMRPATVNRIDG